MGYLSKFLGITAAVMFLSVSVVGAEEKRAVEASRSARSDGRTPKP